MPDGCPEIVLNLADPYERPSAESPPARQPLAMVVGQITGALHLRPTGRTRLVGIRLQPWAGAGLLGVSMTEIQDGHVDLGDLAPTFAPLRDLIGEAPEETRMATAWEALEDLVRPLRNGRSASVAGSGAAAGPGIAIARGAVSRIVARGGTGRVSEVAEDLGVTPRTIEREMRLHVGVTPRDLRRIVRVQRALRLLRETPEPVLGRVGLRAGYFDHAHFCREFRRMAGVSPTDFLVRERGLTEAFLA